MALVSSSSESKNTITNNQSQHLCEILEFSVVPRESWNAEPSRTKRKFATLDVITTQSQTWNAEFSLNKQVVKSYGKVLKWPSLDHFNIDNYRICLALCSQTLLWKTLEQSPSLDSWRISGQIHLAVWCLALATILTISMTYILKCIFYVHIVKKEYFHRVGVNYFFAPWISCMLLTLGVPPTVAKNINPAVWCVFVTPLILLELRIYAKWFTGGKRMLSMVANPSTYLSIVGNFVAAMLAARVGWKEAANFMFSVGFAHYTVLFVTLYQRLPMNMGLPRKLNPTFFLFLAGPSTASLAWESISGTFGLGSKMPYFLSVFLFATMVVRLNFISGSRFSIKWWAYVFPVTALAIATIKYAEEMQSPILKIIGFVFSFMSIGTVGVLVVATVVHYLVCPCSIVSLQQCRVLTPIKRRKTYQHDHL